MRRSSRSVCLNIAEAWRKRRYKKAWVSKLNDSEGEAEETRVSLAFSYHFGYLSAADTQRLDDVYDKILGQLVNMAKRPEQWLIS